MYLTHESGVTRRTDGTENIAIALEKDTVVYSHLADLFLPGKGDPYGPCMILAPTEGAPGLPVDFIRSLYMRNVPKPPDFNHPTWERWLYDWVGIRERLRLVSQDRRGLSDAVLYVHMHRPAEFLGFLGHLWLYEGSIIKALPSIKRQIQLLSAKQLCQIEDEVSLKDSWLPLPRLRNGVARYMERPEVFPFLKFPMSEMNEFSSAKWAFLNESLLVGKEDDLKFMLRILDYIQKTCPEPSSVLQSQRIFNLYEAIYAQFTLARDEKERKFLQ